MRDTSGQDGLHRRPRGVCRHGRRRELQQPKMSAAQLTCSVEGVHTSSQHQRARSRHERVHGQVSCHLQSIQSITRGILLRCTYMCLNQNPLSHSYFAFNNFEGGVSTGSVRCQRLSSGQSGARCSLPLREQPRAFRRSRTAFSACRSARKHVRRVKYIFSRENQVRYTRAQPPSSLCHRVDSDTAHCFERRSIVALN